MTRSPDNTIHLLCIHFLTQTLCVWNREPDVHVCIFNVWGCIEIFPIKFMNKYTAQLTSFLTSCIFYCMVLIMVCYNFDTSRPVFPYAKNTAAVTFKSHFYLVNTVVFFVNIFISCFWLISLSP